MSTLQERAKLRPYHHCYLQSLYSSLHVTLYSVIDLTYLCTGKSGHPVQTTKHFGSKNQIIDSFCIPSYD